MMIQMNLIQRKNRKYYSASTPTKITQVPLDEAQPKVEMTNIITVNEDEEDTNKEGNTDVTVDVQATTGENDNSDAKVTV